MLKATELKSLSNELCLMPIVGCKVLNEWNLADFDG